MVFILKVHKAIFLILINGISQFNNTIIFEGEKRNLPYKDRAWCCSAGSFLQGERWTIQLAKPSALTPHTEVAW